MFATANAELFAKGAIAILSSIPDVNTLCFGAENADKTAFLNAATLLNNEPEEISQKIRELLENGMSYAKARATAWKELLPDDLLSSPNNILGLEYTKAILAANANIDILPLQRIGSGYNDKNLQKNYSSATAIRTAIYKGEKYAENIPDFVVQDMPRVLETHLETLEKYALLATPLDELAKVCDCSEGLENALKKAAGRTESLVDSLTSARYTSSRIRRIALQNLLKIKETLIRDCLQSPLYLRILAVQKARKDLLSALSEASFPLIARPRGENVLTGAAKECYAIDIFAEKIYGILCDSKKEINIFIE